MALFGPSWPGPADPLRTLSPNAWRLLFDSLRTQRFGQTELAGREPLPGPTMPTDLAPSPLTTGPLIEGWPTWEGRPDPTLPQELSGGRAQAEVLAAAPEAPRGTSADYWPAVLQTGLGLLGRSGWQRTPMTLGAALGGAGAEGLQTFLGLRQEQRADEMRRQQMELQREQIEGMRQLRQAQFERVQQDVELQRQNIEWQRLYAAASPAERRQMLEQRFPEEVLKAQLREPTAPPTTVVGVAGKPDLEQRVAWNPQTRQYDIPVGAPRKKGALVNVAVGMTPEQAGKTELLNQGISDMQEFRDLIMPGGKINRQTVLNLNVPGFAGVPGTESRTAYSLLYNAIEAKLRAETGAAATQAEIERIAERFTPTPLDSDETIRSKVKRLDAYLRGTYGRIKGAGTPRTAGEAPEEKDPWE